MTEDQSGTRPCGSPATEKEVEAPTREEIEQVIINEEPTEPVKIKKPRAKAKPTITKEEIVLA
eukprot:11457237-Heterocapsa_arctica.AAC.1